MKSSNSIILFVMYSMFFIILVIYTTLPDELRTIERSLEFQTIIDVEKKNLFDVMANVENYPLILPNSYVSVQILDKTDNSIISLETVKEAGIQTTFKVKHDFIQYDSHQITILDGDAKDSSIILWFNDYDINKTRILVKSDLKLKGIMIPFGIIPDENIHHAFNTVLNGFTEYLEKTKNQNS